MAASGAGTLILTGANNFTGGTTVSNGMLQAANAGACRVTTSRQRPQSGVSVGSGATLAINVGNPSSDWLSAQVDGLVGNAAFAPGATLGFDTTNGNFSYSTNLTGNMSVAKFGPNTLTLSGANSYGGTTTVNAGALQAANAGALPGYATSGQVTVVGGAALNVNVGGSGWISGQIDSLLAQSSFNYGTNGMLTTYATLGFDTTNATSGFAYSTNITTPSLALTKLGPNTLTLGGANTFSGGVTVNAGTLQLGNASALGSGGLTVNPGATVDLNGYRATISPPLDGYTASFLVGGGYLSGPARQPDHRQQFRLFDNDPDGDSIRHFDVCRVDQRRRHPTHRFDDERHRHPGPQRQQQLHGRNHRHQRHTGGHEPRRFAGQRADQHCRR